MHGVYDHLKEIGRIENFWEITPMPLAALVCVGLLGWLDEPAAPNPDPAVAAQYEQAKGGSSRTPGDQIRLALWCEAHGLTAERMRHLALAVLADPTNATARGLSGLVAREGRWVQPDFVAQTVRTDPAARALLAEYDTRRSKTAYNADAQWALGLWAEENGLKDQAKAHYTAVTRLDPSRELAWKRLGYKKHDGHWATDAQITASRTESEVQKHADRTWKPKFEKWKAMLAQPSRKDEARAALIEVTDSRAFRSIWAVFGSGNAANQLVAVQLLGQIEGGPASLALADLSVRGQSPEVRRISLETLSQRDPRDFVGALIRLVRTPWKYEVRPVNGPGSQGELFIEGERFNVRRIYAPPAMDQRFTGTRLFDESVPLWSPNGQPNDFLAADILRQASFNNAVAGRGFGVGGFNAAGMAVMNATAAATRRDIQVRQNQQVTLNDAMIAQQALAANVREVDAANATIREVNDRVLPILAKVTGQNLGEDQEAWNRWNTEKAGYAFQSSTSEKPTFTEVVALEYQTRPPHTACFGMGTPVRTIDGTKLIETVQRGDLVLVQDTATGALSYQPVLTAFHNPPSATLRVKLDDEVIIATGIHRFWKAGKGWVMARELSSGDFVRILGGVARVEAVSPEVVQPVFNLEVAEGRSFFVGRLGALVHDNSLVEATPSPFDAARPRDAVASTATTAAAVAPR